MDCTRDSSTQLRRLDPGEASAALVTPVYP
jgi:hypothetical protein